MSFRLRQGRSPCSAELETAASIKMNLRFRFSDFPHDFLLFSVVQYFRISAFSSPSPSSFGQIIFYGQEQHSGVQAGYAKRANTRFARRIIAMK
jgi:hypothetical protein